MAPTRSLISNQTVSVAASPEPFQALRASSFCFCIAASKAASVDADAARLERILRQIEREAEGVVELEGGIAGEHVALLQSEPLASPRSPRPFSSVLRKRVSSSFSVSVISACARTSSG